MKIRSMRAVMAGLLLPVVLFGAGCTKTQDAATTAATKPVTITIWSAQETNEPYEAIMNDFRKSYPFVSFDFRRIRMEEYEGQLLNALAEDRGPDIFLVHNTWVTKYLPKMLPMPPTTRVAEQSIEGSLQKQMVYNIVTAPTVTLKTFKSEHPDAVLSDLVREVNVSKVSDAVNMQERIVGIPMSIDTLAMFVNKDLLNASGIALIPETWDKFQDAVKKITKQSVKGEIVQSGAALGTSSNIERASDIVSVLMMQNGAQMTDDAGNPTFQVIPKKYEGVRDEPPAFQALRFYTDFANPGKEVYTWNSKQPTSLDAFLQGNVAFFFGYSYHLPLIRARAPKLNLAIAKLPQIEGNDAVNLGNYWSWVVSKKSKSPDISWRFLDFMRKKEEAQKYLTMAKKPAALRSLLPGQLEDEDIGVFASQVLTAKTWYRGNDPVLADQIMNALVDQSIGADPETLRRVVNVASQAIAQTVQ